MLISAVTGVLMQEVETVAGEILDAIVRGGEEVLEPEVDLNRPQGFYYPFLEREGLKPTAVEELEALVARGDLERIRRYTILLCPRDGNAHMRAAQVCPSCGSEDVHKQVLIEHFRCGHIAAEGDFRREDGLVCPKCGRRLKLLGKDFRRPADFHRCRTCEETTYIPDLRLHCSEDGRYYAAKECKRVPAYAYRLRKEEKPGAVYAVLKEVARTMEASGYTTKVLQDVEGRSGVKHRVDLHASKEIFGLRTEVLLDVAVSSKAVTSKPLIALFAKGEDLRISNLLFAAIPELEESARQYANFHGIRVLEAELKDVRERLARFIHEELFIGAEAGAE